MSDRSQILGAVVRLSQAKNAEISEGVQRTYVDLLADLPAADVIAACGRLARTKTYGFPQAGEIREEVTKGTVGDIKGRALIAWAEVMKACRQAGAYRSLSFQDPAMGNALRVAAGTWPNMCRLETGSFEFSKVRETFLEMYERYGAVPMAGEVRLGGLSESKDVYLVPRIDGLSNDRLLAAAAFVEEMQPPSRDEAKRLLSDVLQRVKKEPAASSPHQTQEQR